MSENVLLLAPSRGLGGGIERYVSTVEAALSQQQIPYRRMDLSNPERPSGTSAKIRFIREARRAVQTSPVPTKLVLAHCNLIPVVRAVAGLPSFAGASVILHGLEAWTGRPLRGRRTLLRGDVRVVAASNFSAGALATTCPANVLHPAVSVDWYNALVEASTRASRTTGKINLITVFRLQDWRNKGLDTLIEAVGLLGDERVQLTVCGSGAVPPDLAARVAPHPWCRITANLSDRDLADQLAGADLVVLATRTRTGKHACGEGFGLVLLEAQIAGTPVIAPAYGGSGDAFQQDMTGVAPLDESAAALAAVLSRLISDDQRRAEMGGAAAAWSRARFEPTAYSRHIVSTLLGTSTAAVPVPPSPVGKSG